MDMLLLLTRRGHGIGFEGPRGFLMDADGRLTHSADEARPAPFANVGFQILKPETLDGEPDGAFSILPVWWRLQGQGRLFGVVMDAFWMHVGDPAARAEAEARITR
jgi:MurNAc alpha-1-phosphate uridylyltransferase